MKKFLFLFLSLSSSVFASSWREWGGDSKPLDQSNFYVAIRGGVGNLSATMENTIPSFSTSYCEYWDMDPSTNPSAKLLGAGVCDSAPSGSFLNDLGTAKWDDYRPNTAELNEQTGFYGVAFGGYLPHHRQLRMELEWVRHADFDYRDDRLYVGYMRDPNNLNNFLPGLDESMEANFKSTVSSSHLLFNLYYDLNEKTQIVGDMSFYVGAGIGLAQNKTTFTLIDPQGELLGTDSPLDVYFKDGKQIEVGTISHENFAWGVTLGANYTLSPHVSLDFGVKYSNLGLIEWGFDENTTLLKSDELIATDYFIGFRFDF